MTAAEVGSAPGDVKKQRRPSTVTFLDPASGETEHFGTSGTARGRHTPDPVLSAKMTLARGNTPLTGGMKTWGVGPISLKSLLGRRLSNTESVRLERLLRKDDIAFILKI